MPPLPPNYELVVVPTRLGLVSVNFITSSADRCHPMISTITEPNKKMNIAVQKSKKEEISDNLLSVSKSNFSLIS
jgi:hypothetical protein